MELCAILLSSMLCSIFAISVVYLISSSDHVCSRSVISAQRYILIVPRILIGTVIREVISVVFNKAVICPSAFSAPDRITVSLPHTGSGFTFSRPAACNRDGCAAVSAITETAFSSLESFNSCILLTASFSFISCKSCPASCSNGLWSRSSFTILPSPPFSACSFSSSVSHMRSRSSACINALSLVTRKKPSA